MCIARQYHTSLESIQIDFSWKCIPEELYQTKKSFLQEVLILPVGSHQRTTAVPPQTDLPD